MTVQPVTLEQVEVIFRNFRGEESQYNSAGNRTFSIKIEDLDLADSLIDEGWALKELRNRDTDELDGYHLPVKLNYKSPYPPRVKKVSLNRKTYVDMTEQTIEMLDYLPIKYVDIALNPYEWSVQGKSGVKAYCNDMWVVIEESALDVKWQAFADGDLPFDIEE